MTFIYIDNKKSSFKLDNDKVLTIWFDEYCEAYQVSFKDSDIDVTSDVGNSLYLMKGGKLVMLNDLLKAAEVHMDGCRQ